MNRFNQWPIFLLIACSQFAIPAAEAKHSCDFIRCRSTGCGCELLKDGWKEVARCDGHQWSYVIEKSGKQKLCTGIDARGGSEEHPCTEFKGELTEFKTCGKAK